MKPWIMQVLRLLGILLAGGIMNQASAQATETAIFAGGCFWCMEAEFSYVTGVEKVTSGYTGGNTEHPTYQEVSRGDTGHIEAIEITYDPKRISYKQLLEVFWSNIDPLDPYGQFCDKGTQYRAGIYYHTPEQQQLAETSKEEMAKKFDKPITTFIRPSRPFYPAEDYHQAYFQKNKLRYEMYRDGCGREPRLEKLRKQMTQKAH